MPFDQLLIGLLILVIFLIAAGIMITRKLPAILTLPIMGAAIAGGTALIQVLLGVDESTRISSRDFFQGVLQEGSLMLHVPMIVAFFGGVISFMMQKSGTAESLVKQGAELIGDNPLGVAVFSMLLIAVLFTSIGGLGAIIMVAMVVLPMLATVGIQPAIAGGIMLIGISLGGILNAGNWVIYTQAPLNVPLSDVKSFAVVLFLLTAIAGVTFICVELYRTGVVRSKTQIGLTLVGSLMGGLVLVWALGREGSKVEQLPPHTVSSALLAEAPEVPGVERLTLPNGTSYRVAVPDRIGGALVAQIPASMLPDSIDGFDRLNMTYQSSQPGELAVLFHAEDRFTTASLFVNEDAGGRVHNGYINLANVRSSTITEPVRIDLVFYPRSKKQLPLTGDVAFSLSKFEMVALPKISTGIYVTRVVIGVLLVVLVGVIFWDIKKRVRRWRQQIVTVKWYAYLIPVIPLVLILAYDMAPLTAFMLGIVYAYIATLRPGSISLSIQSLIQGSATVIPAVMLMVGIGILIRAVLGPAGWSEAHGGAEWPVLSSIGPIFQQIVPSTALGYVVVFGLAAPLALYRGPLNVWGLGYGIAALLLTGGNIGGAAVMAMLLTVGQVQGICDPTNTHNVWLANELRVDVQALLWRTIPYVWAMVFVGLTVAAIWHM